MLSQTFPADKAMWCDFFKQMDAWRGSDALHEFQEAEGTGQSGREWMHDVVANKQTSLIKHMGLDPADLRKMAVRHRPLPLRKTRLNPDIPLGKRLPQFPLLALDGTPVQLPIKGKVAVVAGSLT